MPGRVDNHRRRSADLDGSVTSLVAVGYRRANKLEGVKLGKTDIRVRDNAVDNAVEPVASSDG